MKAHVGIDGILYLPSPLITESSIRDRFIACIAEVLKSTSQVQIAEELGTSNSYLTKMKTADNPKIPVSLIANFCSTYRYSPFYILLGKGDRRAGQPEPQEKKDLHYLKIIESLTEALPKKSGKSLIADLKKRRQ